MVMMLTDVASIEDVLFYMYHECFMHWTRLTFEASITGIPIGYHQDNIMETN